LYAPRKILKKRSVLRPAAALAAEAIGGEGDRLDQGMFNTSCAVMAKLKEVLK